MFRKQIITVGFEHGATTSISNFRKIYDYFHGSKKTKIEFIIQIGPRNLWIQLNQINLN